MATNTNYYDIRETFPSDFAITDFVDQLAMFKVHYNTEDIFVKYLDDENEEVSIHNQDDLNHAYQIALGASDNSLLKLIIRNSKGDIVAKPRIRLDAKVLKVNKELTKKATEVKNLEEELEKLPKLQKDDLIKSIPKDFTQEQLKWLTMYLDNFKKDVLNEFEDRIKWLNANLNLSNKISFDDDLICLDSEDSTVPFELKIQKLLLTLLRSKSENRPLKASYLEEELSSTGAFCAVFIKDYNIPDGTKCNPGTKFLKTWLIKNTGKLTWSDENFEVKLILIAGNINTNNGEDFVRVSSTKPNETVSVSVDLVAPLHSGKYFSEWVLSCNGFEFGPRIWCSIEVVENDNNQYEPDIRIDSSLNQTLPSSIETTVETKEEKNEDKYFNNKSLNRTQNLSNTTDDLDDEFVVVPDCFDLSKKWKKSSIDDKERKDSISENPKNDHSFLNVNSEEKEQETLNKEKPSDLHIKNNDETLVDILSTTTTSNASEAIQVLTPTSSIELNANNELAKPASSLVNQSVDQDLLKLLIGINNQPIRQASTNSNQNEQNNKSTFDLVKNAFGNLGGPTLSETNFTLTDESTKEESTNSNTFLEDYHRQVLPAAATTAASTQAPTYPFNNNKVDIKKLINKVPETNAEKLVVMGFANRALNERLLKKYNNDMEKVIQSLLDNADNNWFENRH